MPPVAEVPSFVYRRYAVSAIRLNPVFKGCPCAGDTGAEKFHLRRPDGDVPALPMQVNAEVNNRV